jgi:hypothetical protein
MPVSSADRNGFGVRFDHGTEGATQASHVPAEALRPTQTAGFLARVYKPLFSPRLQSPTLTPALS